MLEGGEQLAKVLWYYNMLPDTSYRNNIVCPFHDETNPSLSIDLEVGQWHCFGCDKHGNGYDFVRYMEPELTDVQSCLKFFEILRSEKCSDIHIKIKRSKPKSMKQLYEMSYDYYHGLSKVDWKTDIGDDVDQIRTYMSQRGFSASTLNQCKAKVSYRKNYSLIFPMLDNGIFRGWVSRTFVPEVEAERKYLYNKGFRRRTTLVGDYGSKPYIILVEGFMDRLKFIQHGYTNVVAILGWKISEQQIEKLKEKGITTIISALDNDKCGRRGTKYLKKHFDVMRFPYLKGLKDPGDMTEAQFHKVFKKLKQMMEEITDGNF